MKKSIIIISLITASCVSDETYCFKCIVAESGQTSEFTRCDITQDEADDISRNGTVVDPDGIKHPYGATMKKYTNCIRQ